MPAPMAWMARWPRCASSIAARTTWNHTELVVNKALEQALRAVKEDGAEAIVLGHTGLIQVARRVSELLEDILGVYVPVIDPNQAGLALLALTAWACAPAG